jgi:hypothetical protein
MGLALLLVSPTLAQQDHNQLLQHWDYDKAAPLDIKQAGIQERDGVTVYDISFSSPAGDRSAAVGPNGGVVTSFLVVPLGKGPFPAVIYGHWCMPGSEKKKRGEFLMKRLFLRNLFFSSLLPDHVMVHPDFAA